MERQKIVTITLDPQFAEEFVLPFLLSIKRWMRIPKDQIQGMDLFITAVADAIKEYRVSNKEETE